MCTLDRIINLLEEREKSQKELTDFLGISKNVFTDWKSGRNKSYTKHLPQIADFLNVSIDYLVGKTDQIEKPSVTEDEELAKYLEFLRTDENYRMMFSLMNGASKEDVEKAVKMVKAFLGED